MANLEDELVLKSNCDDGSHEASLIYNCRRRGPNETLTDALRQGEAAQDEESRAKIVAMLKRASRS